MRKKIVAGNWKMNTTPTEGLKLTKGVIAESQSVPEDVTLIIIPPFTHLSEITKMVKGTRVKVGAQNCAKWTNGAYTGEVSVKMLTDLGVEYVVIGHSERREYFNEDGATLLEKVKLALAANLTPIFCCGEKLNDREANNHFKIVEEQIAETILQLNPEDAINVIVAYEPVWAIGTGKTATADQAQEMHAHIRQLLNAHFGKQIASSISILYGGSCKPSNASEIFSKPDVDGGLIGGASLVATDFIAIAKSF
ncbi:MAG: triose-phosphate isomerase [Bacteroidales bacterium]|nr:triose-phosphate isomerase [Bacteroidales bacterium]HPD94846.1 triose-phosphate isomerase [Tenuifilaceae bacterium]